MAKKVVGYIKLQVPAGQANPSPPIGPALGQRGLNIMEFCKAFNAATQKMEQGSPVPVVITALPGQVLHLRDEVAAGVVLPEEGRQDHRWLQGARQGLALGTVTMAQCREIAEQKLKGMNARDVDAAAREIAGSARSMGLQVVE